MIEGGVYPPMDPTGWSVAAHRTVLCTGRVIGSALGHISALATEVAKFRQWAIVR